MTLISMQGIHKIYGNGESAVRALNNIEATIESGDFSGDRAHDQSGLALLDKRVAAKTSDSRRGDGEVTFLSRLVLLQLPIVHDAVSQRLGIVRCQWLLRDRRNLPVDLHRRRKPDGYEKVRPVLLLQELEKIEHELDSLFSFHFAAPRAGLRSSRETVDGTCDSRPGDSLLAARR